MKPYVLSSLFVLCLTLQGVAAPRQVTVGWTPPTTYTDGAPASPSAIGGYKLHVGTSTGTYPVTIDVGNVTQHALGLESTVTHYVVVSAYDVAEMDSATSTPELVIQAQAPGDTTPPTVSLTAPTTATVPRGSPVTLAATATDNVGVTTVLFTVNTTVVCTDTVSPYTCTWNVPGARHRTYTLQAKAMDAAGNVGVSPLKTVTTD